jgi:heme/copper-type cytochrome/quinol oxidase subunit 1
MAGMAGIYFWYPKMTGRMLREDLGKLHFWLMFVGSQLAFLPQYVLGLHGMPRRVATYPELSWVTLNQWSTVGAVIIALSVVVFVINYYVSWRKPMPAGRDPWGGHALEWWTTSPPPHHNYESLPLIRSERPTWDARHPEHRTIPHSNRRELVTRQALP